MLILLRFFTSFYGYIGCAPSLLYECRQKGAVAVRQPYIRVVGIEQATESSSRGISSFSTDEVRCSDLAGQFHII